VTWVSSAPTLATVSNAASSQGLVTGTGVGTATITAATESGVSGTTTVTVTAALQNEAELHVETTRTHRLMEEAHEAKSCTYGDGCHTAWLTVWSQYDPKAEISIDCTYARFAAVDYHVQWRDGDAAI